MRFAQIKLTARDPAALAGFYVDALGCEVLLGPTPVQGAVSQGAGAPGSVLELTILALPGDHDPAPTLELYRFLENPPDAWPYAVGSGQIAFYVDDVEAAATAVVAAGGTVLGEVVDWIAPFDTVARFVYLQDPEGNLVDVWTSVAQRTTDN